MQCTAKGLEANETSAALDAEVHPEDLPRVFHRSVLPEMDAEMEM